MIFQAGIILLTTTGVYFYLYIKQSLKFKAFIQKLISTFEKQKENESKEQFAVLLLSSSEDVNALYETNL